MPAEATSQVSCPDICPNVSSEEELTMAALGLCSRHCCWHVPLPTPKTVGLISATALCRLWAL